MLSKFKMLALGFLILIMLIASCTLIIQHATSSFLFDNTDDIPHNKVGVVLGTSKFTKSGEHNNFYIKRLEAAKMLYEAGKVDFLIVSGDNRAMNYNEPETMRRDLINMGIPSQIIYLDYAGFRTLDSMVRAKHIFGQHRFTVISQGFHNERAVFIARNKDIHAIGFNAGDVPLQYGARVMLRELIAKVKVFYDLYTNTEPRFYGESVSIK